MIWMVLANVLIVYYLYICTNSLSKSAIIGYICFSSITFLSATILSMFSLYNKLNINLLWIIVTLILCLIIKKKSYSLQKILKQIKVNYCEVDFIEKSMVCAIVAIGIFALIRALTYPPQNVDSLVYHLPRSFYYYKNASLHNIPATSGWTNYTSPANAVFMTQLLSLCNGSDFLLNTIQLPSLFMGAFSCNLICGNLGLSRRIRLLSSLMVICLPLATLQATTTQCDLLVASYCVITVALMITISGKDRLEVFDFILLGLAGGCAVYTKLTAGMTLLLATSVFSIMLIRKFKVKSFPFLILTGGCGILLNLFYWVNNYMDLNGDFLALNISSSLSGNLLEVGKRNYLGRLILNIGYIMGGRDYAYGQWLSEKCQHLYRFIGANECLDIDSYIAYSLWDNHDIQPYGLYTWLIIIAFFLALIMRKKIDLKMKVYIIFSTVTLIFSALFLSSQYSVHIQSAPRYLLPAAIICIPNICIIINILFINSDVHNRYKTQCAVFVMAALVITEGLHASLFDNRQPLPIWDRVTNSNYEELRDYPYLGKGWKDAKKEYFDKISEQNITKIGIWEETLSGIYPMLNVLHEKKYEVKSIFGIYGNQHMDLSFEPEAIIYVGQKDGLPDRLEHGGKTYLKDSEGNELTWNNAASCLYLIDSKMQQENRH